MSRMTTDSRHPILSGLAALAAVSVGIGVIAGVGAMLGVKASGLAGGDATGTSTAEPSMYLPKPAKTTATDSPPELTDNPTSSVTDNLDGIVLTAGQSSVAPMGQIDLTGSFPGGDGAILQVQRFSGGVWLDFPVSAAVNGESFSTYVQTSQLGVNRFRMFDRATEATSNVVKVSIG